MADQSSDKPVKTASAESINKAQQIAMAETTHDMVVAVNEKGDRAPQDKIADANSEELNAEQSALVEEILEQIDDVAPAAGEASAAPSNQGASFLGAVDAETQALGPDVALDSDFSVDLSNNSFNSLSDLSFDVDTTDFAALRSPSELGIARNFAASLSDEIVAPSGGGTVGSGSGSGSGSNGSDTPLFGDDTPSGSGAGSDDQGTDQGTDQGSDNTDNNTDDNNTGGEDTPPVSLPRLTIADQAVNEDEGTVTITLRLDSANHQGVTVDYQTADGTALAGSDYLAANGTLAFAAGETVKTITLNILDDTNHESGESFAVNLSNVSGATLSDGHAEIAILDNDPAGPSGDALALLLEGSVVREQHQGADQEASFTFTLNHAHNHDVVISYRLEDLGAVLGQDYQGDRTGTVTIAAGQTSATLTLDIVGDTNVESLSEVVRLNIESVTAPGDNNFNIDVSVPTANAVIIDDDFIVNVGDATVIEGDGGMSKMRFEISLDKPNDYEDVTVRYRTVEGTAEDGTDYHGVVEAQIVIPAGQRSAFVDVDVVGDSRVEDDEAFQLEILGASAGSSPLNDGVPGHVEIGDAIGDAVIVDDDSVDIAVGLNPSMALGGAKNILFEDSTDNAAYIMVKQPPLPTNYKLFVSLDIESGSSTAIGDADASDITFINSDGNSQQLHFGTNLIEINLSDPSLFDGNTPGGPYIGHKISLHMIDDNILELPEDFTFKITEAYVVDQHTSERLDADLGFNAGGMNVTSESVFSIYDFEDVSTGGRVASVATGTEGDDILLASNNLHGNDRQILNGEDGDDVLVGSKHSDVMIGGKGADHFVFGKESLAAVDVIEDFDAREDHLDFSGLLKEAGQDAKLSYHSDGTDMVVSLETPDAVHDVVRLADSANLTDEQMHQILQQASIV